MHSAHDSKRCALCVPQVLLGQLSKPGDVYRGLSGREMPKAFTEDPYGGNEFHDKGKTGELACGGYRGGTEFGFMSTTTNRDQADKYAGQQTPSTILQLSATGCYGADLSWLSQYPEEKEITYPPFTFLRVLEIEVDRHKVFVLEPQISQQCHQVVALHEGLVPEVAGGRGEQLYHKLRVLVDGIAAIQRRAKPIPEPNKYNELKTQDESTTPSHVGSGEFGKFVDEKFFSFGTHENFKSGIQALIGLPVSHPISIHTPLGHATIAPPVSRLLANPEVRGSKHAAAGAGPRAFVDAIRPLRPRGRTKLVHRQKLQDHDHVGDRMVLCDRARQADDAQARVV